MLSGRTVTSVADYLWNSFRGNSVELSRLPNRLGCRIRKHLFKALYAFSRHFRTVQHLRKWCNTVGTLRLRPHPLQRQRLPRLRPPMRPPPRRPKGSRRPSPPPYSRRRLPQHRLQRPSPISRRIRPPHALHRPTSFPHRTPPRKRPRRSPPPQPLRRPVSRPHPTQSRPAIPPRPEPARSHSRHLRKQVIS
jgi:hypothetical protein